MGLYSDIKRFFFTRYTDGTWWINSNTHKSNKKEYVLLALLFNSNTKSKHLDDFDDSHALADTKINNKLYNWSTLKIIIKNKPD